MLTPLLHSLLLSSVVAPRYRRFAASCRELTVPFTFGTVRGMLRDYRMLIGGEWVDAASGETFETVNPFTGRAWATVPRARAEDVDRAVAAARAAFGDWRALAAVERGRQAAPARRADRRERFADRHCGDDRQREADPRDGGPAARAGRLLPLLRGRGGQAARGDDPRRPHELPHLHAARAGRGGGGDHAVELAGAARLVEARAGAGRRLHGRGEAGRAGAGLDTGVRCSCSRRPASRRVS